MVLMAWIWKKNRFTWSWYQLSTSETKLVMAQSIFMAGLHWQWYIKRSRENGISIIFIQSKRQLKRLHTQILISLAETCSTTSLESKDTWLSQDTLSLPATTSRKTNMIHIVRDNHQTKYLLACWNPNS